jgi:hypothetical protein
VILIAPERVIFARRGEIEWFSPFESHTCKRFAQVVLTQKSLYPFDSVVQFDVRASQAKDFTVSFRIPAWATGASISVNGRVQPPATPGFAAIHRQWSTGDRLELDLPMASGLQVF